MTTRPEALRLADRLECSTSWDRAGELAAATELRRLHAENASLAAALASSCDEQRHELWESGGIAGCERARVAERQRDALLEALKKADHFITNGIELGFIRMPDADTPDTAHETPGIVRAAIKAVEGGA